MSNAAKRKGWIAAGQQPPWWPLAVFQLNRSGCEKSSRSHHQCNTGALMRNATARSPACQDRDKGDIHFQGVCFPFEQTLSTPLHVPVPQHQWQWACPPQEQKARYSTRAKTSVQRSTLLDCLLPACWFFRHRIEYRAQTIARGFFSGKNNKRKIHNLNSFLQI